jgi:hypothetical protein
MNFNKGKIKKIIESLLEENDTTVYESYCLRRLKTKLWLIGLAKARIGLDDILDDIVNRKVLGVFPEDYNV